MKRFFIFAGEASGDLHGCQLIRHLRDFSAETVFEGVGGPQMRSEGLNTFMPMENFQVMGFSDVLCAFPRLYRYFYQIRQKILDTNPDAVILIDYPGFNLRLARTLRKVGFKGKIIQYIAPSVWAHGKNRIEWMSSSTDLLLTIYPFEAAYFAHTPLKVEYVGNPLIENLKRVYNSNWKASLGIKNTETLMALFPGSREGEIVRNLPSQLRAAELLQAEYPDLSFALSVGQNAHSGLIQKILHTFPLTRVHLVPSQFNYELMKEAHTAIAKSGTVTLELALHKCPTVVTYALSSLNYFVAKYLLRLRLPHYCIVNILEQQEIFPEVIGTDVNGDKIFPHLKSVFGEKAHRQKIYEGCENLIKKLECGNAHQNAAKAILAIL